MYALYSINHYTYLINVIMMHAHVVWTSAFCLMLPLWQVVLLLFMAPRDYRVAEHSWLWAFTSLPLLLAQNPRDTITESKLLPVGNCIGNPFIYFLNVYSVTVDLIQKFNIVLITKSLKVGGAYLDQWIPALLLQVMACWCNKKFELP